MGNAPMQGDSVHAPSMLLATPFPTLVACPAQPDSSAIFASALAFFPAGQFAQAGAPMVSSRSAWHVAVTTLNENETATFMQPHP